MDREIKNREWREAATGGLILGLALTVTSLLGYIPGSAGQTLSSWLIFLLIGVLSFSYARKISYLYSDQGFTIGQSMGFILKMMLFAGIIAGFGSFLLIATIDTGQYLEVAQQSMGYMEMTPQEQEITMKLFSGVIRNPIIMVILSVFTMVIYGGLIGLVVSAFVRRAPK